jgi:2-hydroxycyclohexanecarboxyl-CoA dehydrogenase
MQLRFDGKTAIVTGGASGIGLSIARELAASGAAVALFDIDRAALDEAARGIMDAGGTVLSCAVDVTDLDATTAGVRDVASRTGGLDIVVTCAGTTAAQGLFAQNDPQEWRRIVDVNLFGTINACYAALPHLAGRGGARIITISSDAARIGSAGEAVYSATKGGVISFTKSLARELAREQVTVNCVAPGATDTPMLRAWSVGQEAVLEKLARMVPLRRLGLPEDVAAMVVFLASDQASYVTGQVFSVSGGVTMA